jgi:hypothetical protein
MKYPINKGRAIRTVSAVCMSLATTFLFAAGARANSYTFDFDTVINGATPAGPSPWNAATFTDTGPGTVSLTISASGFFVGEYLDELMFNLNPADNPSNLSFKATQVSGSFTTPTISKAENGFSEGSQSGFDFELAFSSASGKQFVAGDILQYSISGIAGLTAADFDYLSTSSTPGVGPFFGLAEVSGISGSSTGWIGALTCTTVAPEPGPAALLPLGTALWAATGWMRSRKKA